VYRCGPCHTGYTQDFNAVVTETERRVDYTSSFGERSDAPQLEATGLVAHQSLNYLAFVFNVLLANTSSMVNSV
jgi:hypothetical protein